MLFSSSDFLFLFLPVVVGISLLLRRPLLNPFLLLASVIFYACGGVKHVPLLAFLILINFAAGIVIDDYREKKRHRAMDVVYVLCIAINILSLIYFKYAGFIVTNLNAALAFTGLHLHQPANHELPLGISFFTFHLLSYVVDIHRGVAKAQRNPLDFGLYICFFPQLIAGPIIRYHDVASQLTDRRVTLNRFASGVERFVTGLGKKVLLADPLAHTVDPIFALSTSELSSPLAWIGICGYALQLYLDFSGYSDMAIGLARMFGFEFLENFNYPYISRSIQEFWRRWHISLGNFFRDYLYIPLGGNRCSPARTALNLLTVFLLCGIWHGASWNFVVWGLIHGLFLALERGRFGSWLKRIPRPLSWLYTMIVVLVGWVFFRCETLPEALNYLQAMAGFGRADTAISVSDFITDRRLALILPIALLAATPIFSPLTRDWASRAIQVFGAPGKTPEKQLSPKLDALLAGLRPPVLLAILALSAVYIAGNTYSPFLYFRF